MKKTLGKYLKVITPVAIGVFFTLYAYFKFTDKQLGEIFGQFAHVKYGYILMSLAFGILSHLSRSYRWNFLLETLGYRIKFTNSIMAVLIAYMMNLFIPRSGEVSRAVVIQKYENVPFSKAMGTVITERLVDLLILIGFVVTALIIQFDTVNTYILQKINLQKLLLIGSFGILILLAIIATLVKSKSQIAQRIKAFMRDLEEGIMAITKIKKRGAFIFHTLFIWGMYLTMFHMAALSIESTSKIGMDATLTTFIVGGIAIAFTNGGFGSYPYLVAEMLLLYEIPETVGTAFGWIVWTSQFLMFVVFGSLAFIFLPIVNKDTINEEVSTSSQTTP